MLEIYSFFTLKTSVKESEKNNMVRNGTKMILTYEIDAESFKDIMRDYPDFSTQVYIRAELRTAHFKYLA